jgi:hypothetical protein
MGTSCANLSLIKDAPAHQPTFLSKKSAPFLIDKNMRFRIWMEREASLGAMMPEMMPGPNRGSDTPASDGVKRTGLQPQVGAEEIHTDQKDEQDRIQAIDAAIQRADQEIPEGSDDGEKVNKFKELWKNLKEKWDTLKLDQGVPEDNASSGLGDSQGDQKMLKLMQQNPNMVQAGPSTPSGPGTFGVS